MHVVTKPKISKIASPMFNQVISINMLANELKIALN